MKRAQSFRPEDIRNIVLLGSSGVGKTTLSEALLHRTGVITRMGDVESETTISDFEPEARSHHHSVSSTALFATFEGREINILDTPGHPELVGSVLPVLPAVETAVLVVDATQAVDFHTRRLFHAAGEAGLARMLVVNKIDQNLSGLPAFLSHLKASFGNAVHAINLPAKGGTDVVDCFDKEAGESDFGSVADIHREMLESTVEIDDAALERYLAGESIDLKALRACFVEAMNVGHVVPVLFAAAKQEVGIDDLLHILVEESPSPLTGRPRRVLRGGTVVALPCTFDKPAMAHVFKVSSDPFTGRLAMLRVLQGQLDTSSQLLASSDKKPRRAGQIMKIEGREHSDLETVAQAGDIVALAKAEDLQVDQILHVPGVEDCAPFLLRYPVPMLSLALTPKTKGDDAKLGTALSRMVEEDPTLRARQDPETREFVVSGLGDVHLRLALEKLKNRHHVSVDVSQPKVAFRESISSRAEGHYRLKKQTGGAGQFAEVFLRVEPLPRGTGNEFLNEVVGGTIPTQFMSAVEKGVEDGLSAGVLAGFAVQDVRVIVYDGKSHPVDSKDIAFRTAARDAVRDALSRARAILLEPIAMLDIAVPETHTGAVLADIKSMRGHVIGMDSVGDGSALVHAHAPVAEVHGYGSRLRAATAGQGSFVVALSHYDLVPPALQQRMAAEYKSRGQ